MEADTRRWRRSYKHIPFGAGEDEISNSSSDDPRAAHRLMEACKAKPPSFELSVETSQLIDGSWYSYLRSVILDENLRYPRVCKELARRVEVDDPKEALALLRSALLPGSCALAFESDDAYTTWWDRVEQQADQLQAELEKLTEEVRSLSGESGEYDEDYKRDVVTRWMEGVLRWGAYGGMLEAAFAISENQDAWNFWIKGSMAALENRLGDREEAWRLKNECLDLLTINDDLWSDVLDRAVEKPPLALPPPAQPPAPVAKGVETAVAEVMNSALGPLVSSMQEIVQISHSLHDRLDFVVEKLIDLDQRSELTWQDIRQSARQEPDYEQVTRDIESSLASRLGEAWRQLEPDSREDLVDAEYVFTHCDRRRRGWRMAVLGYCTTVERELRITYATARNQVASLRDAETAAIDTLGDLIRAVEKLASWLRSSKRLLPALNALLDSTKMLWDLNDIRRRAVHPKEKKVSRKDAGWARDALLVGPPGPLLVTMVAARAR